MPFLLTLPKLSPTMEEGTIAKWHQKIGNHVAEGDLILEVATDKATVEYNALDEGYLRKILIPEGGEAKVNQPIALFSVDPNENIDNFALPEHKKEAPAVKEAAQEPAPAKEAQEAPTGLPKPVFKPEAPLENYRFPYKTEVSE